MNVVSVAEYRFDHAVPWSAFEEEFGRAIRGVEEVESVILLRNHNPEWNSYLLSLPRVVLLMFGDELGGGCIIAKTEIMAQFVANLIFDANQEHSEPRVLH